MVVARGDHTPSYILHARAFGTYLLGGLQNLPTMNILDPIFYRTLFYDFHPVISPRVVACLVSSCHQLLISWIWLGIDKVKMVALTGKLEDFTIFS